MLFLFPLLLRFLARCLCSAGAEHSPWAIFDIPASTICHWQQGHCVIKLSEFTQAQCRRLTMQLGSASPDNVGFAAENRWYIRIYIVC